MTMFSAGFDTAPTPDLFVSGQDHEFDDGPTSVFRSFEDAAEYLAIMAHDARERLEEDVDDELMNLQDTLRASSGPEFKAFAGGLVWYIYQLDFTPVEEESIDAMSQRLITGLTSQASIEPVEPDPF